MRVFFVGEPVDLAHTLRRATLRNGIRHAEAEPAWLGETVEALSLMVTGWVDDGTVPAAG